MRTKLILIGALILMACALHRVDLVDNGTVLLEKSPSEQVHISTAKVYQDKDELVVYGKVCRDDGSSIVERGHIDIMITAPDGTIIKQTSVADHLTNVNLRYMKDSTFTARFPMIPQPGTKIHLTYHRANSEVSPHK